MDSNTAASRKRDAQNRCFGHQMMHWINLACVVGAISCAEKKNAHEIPPATQGMYVETRFNLFICFVVIETHPN